MAQKKLLTNGKAFKRSDDRWGGTVWYMDEKGERKRNCFSGTTKAKATKEGHPLFQRKFMLRFNSVHAIIMQIIMKG